jgi:hypothetical protein
MSSPRICLFCQRGESLDEPLGLTEDSYQPGVWYHSRCISSEAGRQWMAARAQEDPQYARYQSLMTQGHPILCPECCHAQAMSPKELGPFTGGGWDLCCDSCSNVLHHSVLDGSLCDRLHELQYRFVRYGSDSGIEQEIQRLAQQYDPLVGGPCSCGGQYSIAAKPRCVRCGAVVYDTCFHYTFEPAETAQQSLKDQRSGLSHFLPSDPMRG